MPKKIDAPLPTRRVRLVGEHAQDYPIQTATVTVMARQQGVSREWVRRWLAQGEVEDGTRPGVTSEESAEVGRLKAENKRLREDHEILRRASIFFAGQLDPELLILAFIEEKRAAGSAVALIPRVLRQQGLRISARTYRSWKRRARIAARAVTDALVEDKIRAVA